MLTDRRFERLPQRVHVAGSAVASDSRLVVRGAPRGRGRGRPVGQGTSRRERNMPATDVIVRFLEEAKCIADPVAHILSAGGHTVVLDELTLEGSPFDL